ncbi:MAG: A24 family peptidase [Ilumatobacteraceae bacterium]
MVEPILEVRNVSGGAGRDPQHPWAVPSRATPFTSPTAERGRSSVWRASAIHADRFGRRRIVSLLTLATADRRVMVSQGVATLTAVPGPVGVVAWTVATAAMFGLALSAGFVAHRPVTVVAMLVFGSLVAIVGGLAAERRMRTARTWSDHRGSWLLADVAGGRGAAAGRPLMDAVTALADGSSRPLVLVVRRSSDRVVQLYREHGFTVLTETGTVVRMQRAPAVGRPPRSWHRAAGIGTGIVIGAAVTAVAIPSPVAWLVPPATLVLTAAAVLDVEQLRIPNVLTGAGFVGLLAGVALVHAETGHALLAGALAGAAWFAGPLFVAHLVTGGRTPGLGDVKLALSAGLLCGAFDVGLALPALVVSCLLGAAMGGVWQHRTGRSGFPFAPAIATGTALTLLVGAALGQVPT